MRIAVLGAGLQGCCAALELAGRGFEIDLFDRGDRCLTGASVQNEGKIHLGYVYANDPSLRTARRMMEGAFSFLPLIRRWLGDTATRLPTSEPFYYVVHRDSLLSVAEVENHFAACDEVAREIGAENGKNYFGSARVAPPMRICEKECSALYDTHKVVAAFRTSEISINPEALAEAVRARLATQKLIRPRLRTSVLRASPEDDGVWVESQNGSAPQREKYDHVINCLWAGRLRIDQTAGVHPARPWLYRLKYYLRIPASSLTGTLPCTTIVLGPFGDVVSFRNQYIYLSWYPVGMKAVSSAIAPPKWSMQPDESLADEIRAGTIDGLGAVVPGVGQFHSSRGRVGEVKGGIVMAWGETDIDDAGSRLHERHEIGPLSRGRYHTVETGKLTTAPLFAKQVADRIREEGAA